MAVCTQCREMTGAPATEVPHDQLVRGATAVFAGGRQSGVLNGLEWYRCIACCSHLIRERDKSGALTQWTLAREGNA